MNNQRLQKTDIAINLKELLWNLLDQWKAVLVAGLIMMVLVSGLGFLKSAQEYKKEAQREAAENSGTPSERIERVMSSLTEDEQMHVTFVLQEQDWLDSQKSYVKKSIAMRTDPTSMRTLKQVYELDLKNKENSGVLSNIYRNYFLSDEMAEAVKPYIDPDIENKYIQELFNNKDDAQESQGLEENVYKLSITMGIILPEDTDAEAVSAAIEKALKAYSKELNKTYAHSVELSSHEVIYQYNSDYATRRTTLFNNVSALEKALDTAKASLSENEKAAVSTITAIKANSDGNGTGSTAGTDTSSQAQRPKLSAKAAIMGFIAGMLLYILAYILLVVIRKRVNCASEAETYTGTRLVGEVYRRTEHKGADKLMHSSAICKKHYDGKFDKDKQIEKMWKTISAICTHGEINKIHLLDISGNTELTADLLNTLKSKRDDSDVEIKTLDFNEEIDENAINEISDSVVLTSDKTKAGVVIKLADLCRDYGVKCRGCVFEKDI